MKISNWVYNIIWLVACMGLIFETKVRLQHKEDILNEAILELNTLKQVINQKDSLIAKEQARIDILVKSDSIRIYSINNSLKTIRNEIKNNSESIWITPDSIHWLQVDSLRTRYGFHKIQRKRK